jgi:S1-C subfamily serine protease
VHVLDAVLLLVLILAAIHGIRVGAVAQVIAFAGSIIGLIVGVALVLFIDPHVSSPATKTGVAIGLLVVPTVLVGGFSRRAGALAGMALQRIRLGPLDKSVGLVVAVCGTLVMCWLFASILLNSSVVGISQAISQSVILRRVEQVMPPVPDAFSAVERYITKNGFPDVLVNVFPESLGPIALPGPKVVSASAAAAGRSTVKIIAIGCGDEQEGSGFVTGDGYVVTNAHVIAGTNNITVTAPNGSSSIARPVLFDPRLDLAVLSVRPLGVPTLAISTALAGRGDEAVVLGYPEDGPFDARPAGIAARFAAEGRDIYDSSITTRIVYELDAVVRPGNSGGPLIASNGTVIGVVFSRSSTNPDIGYALASPAVASELVGIGETSPSVGTESCVT